MRDVWVPPQPVVRLEGTVVYTCHSCGSTINGDHVVLWPLEDGELVSATRAYHPEHRPLEVTDGR
jgi:hypothetical protein